MYYTRNLHLAELIQKKSFFLFGPRSTGKTHLIRTTLKNACYVNLLKTDVYLRLSQTPSDLEMLIADDKKKNPIVIIDEIQKVPALLDEVHRLIEEKHIKFLLTGSSARKLKRSGVNLLAGRAWTANLFPLCFDEIPNFKLEKYLRFGGLPHVYKSEYPEEELEAYVLTYLKEEILAEGLIRNLPPFSRFLKTAAFSNGQQLNFTEIGNDCQVSPSTVREYYKVLEDTLVGFLLESYTQTQKRKALQTGKFYFFDTGVTHALAGTKFLERNSNLYGASFEQFIGMELRAYLSYRRIKDKLTFWRSVNGQEVDYLVGESCAIEVKSSQKISDQHVKGLKYLKEEDIFEHFFMVSQDRFEGKKDGIIFYHWETFLQKMWNDELPFSS